MSAATKNAADQRAASFADRDEFERLRERAAQIRAHTIDHMAYYLRRFEKNATAAGAVVLWAKDAAAARAHLLAIAARHKVRLAVKSKSMVSEEIGLNAALAAAGCESVETDLGEFIVQLADEPPSHIIAPAVHKTALEVEELFARKLGRTPPADFPGGKIPALAAIARRRLRENFLRAEMGVCGANFLVAETGSALVVSNEGNGRFCATLPPAHVTLAGIDKILPTWRDAATMLDLLPRSATGQRISEYVTATTGTAAAENPRQTRYVVLLDNGRAALRDSPYRAMLRCIRCGACMNHCPVYETIGGHAYGSPYMGPMGMVLTPAIFGRDFAPDMPHAATMCGQCEVVCPVKIPLPDLFRRLREEQAQSGRRPWAERAIFAMWFFAASRPRLYALLTAAAARLLRLAGGRRGFVRLPIFVGGGWFARRDLPSPAAR